MRNLLYFLIKTIIGFGYFCYYKKVRFKGLKNVPLDKPVIFLPNHQNALMDPLLVAIYGNRKPYFLTRSDVFTNSFLNKLFDLFQMLPIYRIRDGRNAVHKNQEVFDQCSDLLNRNNALLIFPEANHNVKRRVRPLSKGFTRIIFNTLDKNTKLDIRLVPVGINYKNVAGFPDTALFSFGKDISAKEKYSPENPRISSMNMRNEVFNRIKELTVHIEDHENYGAIIRRLDGMEVDYLDPERVNGILANFDAHTKEASQKKTESVLLKLWEGIFWLLNVPVLLIWRLVIRKKVPEAEFLSTYRFLFSLLIYPLFFIALFVLAAVSLGYGSATILILGLFVFNLLYVKFR